MPKHEDYGHENGKCCSETVTTTRCQLNLLTSWRRDCPEPVPMPRGGTGRCSMKIGHGGGCILAPEDAELRPGYGQRN